MQNRFEHDSCNACGKPFAPNDQIVVCPECGTPYHRGCINSANDCVNADRHGTDFSYQPPTASDSNDSRLGANRAGECPRCGATNPPSATVCQVCSAPLAPTAQTEDNPTPRMSAHDRSIPLNPFFNPFGGVHPTEKIDDVCAKDLVVFVRQNSHRFLPRFRAIAQNRKRLTWNWGAFIFESLYYFYRKLYVWGAIWMVLFALLSIASLALDFLLFKGMLSVQTAMGLQMGLSFVTVVARLSATLLFDKLYLRHATKKIKACARENLAPQDYLHRLSSRGGTSLLAAWGSLALATVALWATLTLGMQLSPAFAAALREVAEWSLAYYGFGTTGLL